MTCCYCAQPMKLLVKGFWGSKDLWWCEPCKQPHRDGVVSPKHPLVQLDRELRRKEDVRRQHDL